MNPPYRPQSDLIETDKKHVWHHLTQHHAFSTADPLIMVEGNGMVVTDVNGREYLDATSGGLWSVNVGYGRKRIAEAVSEQLTKMCFFAGTGGTVPGVQFSERLIEKMPGMSRVYFSSSGSEANEKGYKMVRQRSHSRSGDGEYKIVYRDRDYHGTTIGALSSSGHNQRREHYGPFAPGFAEFAHCC